MTTKTYKITAEGALEDQSEPEPAADADGDLMLNFCLLLTPQQAVRIDDAIDKLLEVLGPGARILGDNEADDE